MLNENMPLVYACFNKNEYIRMKSSSGGIFTLIAEKVLEQNGIVYGAAFNSNLDVEHIAVKNVQDLEKIRGSKYVQSILNGTFKKIENLLKDGKKILFTGTPCQVESLKVFLKYDYQNLYTQDMICHGMPIKKIWEKYIKEKEKEFGKIKKFSFRNKDNKGWSNYQILIETEKEKNYINHEDDLYMRIFLNDIALKEPCYNCKFKKKLRNSDITLGDFWGINDIAKEMNDEKGTSLIFIHSQKGIELFNSIKDKIIFKEVNFEQSIKNNGSMIKSVERPKIREDFIENLENFSLKELCEKYL